MRDTKLLESFKKKVEKKLKEMDVFKSMRQEVNTGANGTQDYVIKKGINKGKVAKWQERPTQLWLLCLVQYLWV